jgi:hypothetical protein
VMLGEFHGFPSHVSHLDDRLRYLNSAVASHGNFGWTRIFFGAPRCMICCVSPESSIVATCELRRSSGGISTKEVILT